MSEAHPEFNASSPSADVQRAVVKVQPDAGTDLTFPFAGFYLMPDMTPDDAKEDLSDAFATVTRSKRPPLKLNRQLPSETHAGPTVR